ncbi:transient receptor potential cation channel subfamily m member 3-like [Plakobranchus ocellatus]|uniref:Transient receptor potential cation channel subfamily m member 3-like n=1 Tax=Plakobranchus ocellatus TaxID=259542 RepID=A0AAV4C1Q1_9GAST|nr:transient receptor potential cation channel subfamily m member 3-like [Plakobranchus ocellatus]
MKEYWHIMEPEPPHLVISVVGGAKNFKLDGRLRDTFSTGLIKAAKTTKAWLITSGFNMGVMKSVGQAVHEGQTFEWDNDRMSHVLRSIGIAPWGYVRGRHVLESNGSGKFNAYYRTSNQILHKQPVPLNPDHTHFIFVDDGYRIRYGGVAQFRSKFEKKISADKREGGLGIPVVLLVVEGGTDAIQDVSASLAQGIPVVVCAGTGRAADILTYAYNHTTTTHDKERIMSDFHQDKLARKIYAAYKSNMKQGKEREELESLKDKILGCCQREDLITIYYMSKHEDLDLAILSVLLKVETNSSREKQLKLALTWDRADIAQEEIFREDVIWKPGSLEEFLTEALVENKVDFVKLLLNNGIIMQEYLTVGRLEHLYNSIPKHSYLSLILKTFTKSDHITLEMVGSFLRSMLDKYEDDVFNKENSSTRIPQQRNSSHSKFSRMASSVSTIKAKVKRFQMDGDTTDNEEEPNCFQRPYKQLLIWAVLMNRYQLAHLFWEMGEEPITSALVCTALCKEMENKVPKYLSVIRSNFHDMKDEFEQLAVRVLDECHSIDPDKAVMLVERRSPTWSDLTCLQVAASAGDQAFVSSVGCQNSLNNVWKSGIMSSWPRIFFSALCPLLVLFILEMGSMGRKIMTPIQKILTFYTAPVTKFSIYTAAYMGFLVLFTYMLLVDYDPDKPSASEWIIMLWILSFLIGALHSFYTFPSPTMRGTLRDYFGILDRLDFANLLLALCAFCVRWKYLYDAKIIYCVNAVVFYIRLMKLYTANRVLGPKIYMINRMLVELAMFLMVLMVFLLAYGVASQGLLYRQRDRDWLILKDILYFPYWQLYGEIFLEEIETDDQCVQDLVLAANGTAIDPHNTCRTYHWLVPILLALYLLIGNILLLNLLIAIFSHVFDQVEQNAIEIWKFQMYFLVMEFQNRPLFAPPFCLLSYCFYLVRLIYRKVACRKRVKSEQFLKHHLVYLSLFEKEMMANMLREVKENIMQSMENKFHILQTRMDELTRVIEDELIAEQHNPPDQGIMQSMTLAEEGENRKLLQKAQFEGQVTTEEKNNLEKVDEPVVTESAKKHKHKKKKKKKSKDHEQGGEGEVDALPSIQEEEKQLNIDIPEREKMAVQDKLAVLKHEISDEENRSPDTAGSMRPQQQRDVAVIRASAARRLPKLPAPELSSQKTPASDEDANNDDDCGNGDVTGLKPSLKAASARRRGSATSGSYLVASPGSASAAISGFRFPTFDPTLMDSDEEPIPLDIYSPRTQHMSGAGLSLAAKHSALSPGLALSSHGGSDASDSDSDVSYRSSKGRTRRTRRHLARRSKEDEDVNSRLQQHASYSRSRSFNMSSKLV